MRYGFDAAHFYETSVQRYVYPDQYQQGGQQEPQDYEMLGLAFFDGVDGQPIFAAFNQFFYRRGLLFLARCFDILFLLSWRLRFWTRFGFRFRFGFRLRLSLWRFWLRRSSLWFFGRRLRQRLELGPCSVRQIFFGRRSFYSLFLPCFRCLRSRSF